ncbi:MAG: hypothetical protein IT314_07490 [Anaerolineales bacterium]|nr:hypothetical protein [Anaerolineales bacterium]
MAKTNVKTKSKSKADKTKSANRKTVKAQTRSKPQAVTKTKTKTAHRPKSIVLSPRKPESAPTRSVTTTKVRVASKTYSSRITPSGARKSLKSVRLPQYNYMKPPGMAHDFQVGDAVEVYCDHEKNRDRVRGWLRGVVVQVDNKLVAVQFRSNVYLTDGWMVPDRILWYPLSSEHMRPVPGKKSARREEKIVPEY